MQHKNCLLCVMLNVFIYFQFGSLLDENAGSKFDNIGLNAMANTDKAGKFETCRHGNCSCYYRLKETVL